MLPSLYFQTVTCSEWLVLRRFILLLPDSKSENRRRGPCVCNITQQIGPHTDKQTTKQWICAGNKQRGKRRDPQRCRLVRRTSSLLPPTAAANFLLNISHLKQTFPPGCLHRRQYVFQHKRGDIMLLPSPVSPDASIKNDSWMGLSAVTDHSAGKEQRNTRIDLRTPQPTAAWLTSNTIKWKREGTEDRHYINHLFFPRLPLSIICAHDLMSFVRSETAAHVKLSVILLQKAQIITGRRGKVGGKKQKEDTDDQTKRCQCLNTRVQSTACARCYSWDWKTPYSTRPIQEAKVADDKCLLWFRTYTFHSTNGHLLVKYIYICIHNGVCSNTKVHF